MDPDLGMTGACIPWQNKHDIEPLLINADAEYIQNKEIPGIRIYRSARHQDPFDVFFCKTKFCAYQILMNIDGQNLEKLMIERSRRDLDEFRRLQTGNASAQKSIHAGT